MEKKHNGWRSIILEKVKTTEIIKDKEKYLSKDKELFDQNLITKFR